MGLGLRVQNNIKLLIVVGFSKKLIFKINYMVNLVALSL